MSKTVQPIDRLASVKLSLSDWNWLLCCLSTAKRAYDHSEGTVNAVQELQDKVREQAEAKISAAFTVQFPDLYPNDSVAR